MFERFRNRSDTRDDYVDENGGGVATATRHDTNGDGVVEERPVAAAPVTRENVRDVRARQRAEYGGLNWGSAFFGWLVAVGMAAILLGLLSAAGAGIRPERRQRGRGEVERGDDRDRRRHSAGRGRS